MSEKTENTQPPIEKIDKDKGLRYNEGKTRFDLCPPFAQEQYARVMTFGSKKYTDRNWELGMKWTKVLASLERHLQAIKNGKEDFDPETGILHSAHIMCNAAFLTEYYKTHPELDDRPKSYLNHPRIGLDLDEILISWIEGWCEYHNCSIPEFWNFDYEIKNKFEKLKEDKNFWLSLKPKIKPSELPFEPHCYITSRNIPNEWTEEWLIKNGFPSVPVYTVGHNQSKVEVAKKAGILWFIDDRFETFVELNNNNICCFLLDAPHNKRYEVGFKRIKDFKDFKDRFL